MEAAAQGCGEGGAPQVCPVCRRHRGKAPSACATAEKALKEWKAPDVKKATEKEKPRETSSEMALLRWNQAIDKAAKNEDAETAERVIGKPR